jgi:hypothetical protein
LLFTFYKELVFAKNRGPGESAYVDGVAGLHLKGDSLARKGLHENLWKTVSDEM